jgi:hypothetical protein
MIFSQSNQIKLFFILFFGIFLRGATSQSELIELEKLSKQSPSLAIAASILQAYPEVEKATIADTFEKAVGSEKKEDQSSDESDDQNKEKKEKKKKPSMQESFFYYYTDEIIKPSEYERKKRAYSIVNAAERQYHASWMSASVIGSSVWRDLNLFYGSIDYPRFFLGEILTKDRAYSEMGKAVFNSLIARPVDDVGLIYHRQDIVKSFMNEKMSEKLDAQLKIFQEHEHMLTGLWGKEQLMQFIKADCYAQSPWKKLDGFVEACNKSPLFMDTFEVLNRATSLLRRFSAIGSIMLFATCATKEALEINIFEDYGLKKVVSMFPGWTWTKDTYDKAGNLKSKDIVNSAYESAKSYSLYDPKMWAAFLLLYQATRVSNVLGGTAGTAATMYDFPRQWDNTKVGSWYDDFFLRRMIRVMECLRVAQNMLQIIPVDVQEKLVFFKSIRHFFVDLYVENNDVGDFVDMMESWTFDPENLDPKKFNLFFRTGKMFAAFRILENIKQHIEPIIAALGEIDAYNAIAKIMCDQSEHWSFVDFVIDAKPSIALDNFWNPLLEPALVIKNSLCLGQAYQTPHIIITGPNSGGKSTALKALAFSIVLGQSIGIAPAQKAALTPFSHLALYMNIGDSIVDKESRFQKEGRQAFAHGDLIRSMAEQYKLSFAIFDEIFSGTSPEEGAEWGYRTARGFAAYPNCICAVATHFKRLTQLEADTKSHFVNYKVSIATDAQGNFVKEENGKLRRTYKIEKGIAHQQIAKEVLQEQGIESQFFNDNFAQ